MRFLMIVAATMLLSAIAVVASGVGTIRCLPGAFIAQDEKARWHCYGWVE